MGDSVIGPETKVGELLRRHPELEETLIRLSPEFQRLKNPVLRATVAKVATLRQVAQVGGLDPEALIKTLREAAGGGAPRRPLPPPGATPGGGTPPGPPPRRRPRGRWKRRPADVAPPPGRAWPGRVLPAVPVR